MNKGLVALIIVCLLICAAMLYLLHVTQRADDSFSIDSRSGEVSDAQPALSSVAGSSEPRSSSERAFDCDSLELPDENAERSTKHFQETEDELARLAESDDVEIRIAVAVATSLSDPEGAHRILSSAEQAAPESPLPLWHLLEFCALYVDAPGCDTVDTRAVTAHGDNAMFLAKAASLRLGRGDKAAALELLEQAGSAAYLDNYWIEHVFLFERALAATGKYSYAERVIDAFGLAAALAISEYDLVKACRQESGESESWRDACLAFAQRLYSDSDTLVDKMIGLAMIKSVYELSGDLKSMRETEAIRTSLSDRYVRNDQDAQLLLVKDHNVMRGYLETWEADGEMAALDFVRSEVERLSQLPGYDPCK
jgi:hypothetical protein